MVLAVLLFLLINLGLNIWNVYSRGKKNYEQLEYEKTKLQSLQAEHDRLNKDLSYYNSEKFIEEYAKDNLQLSKDGESLYKIVDEQTQSYDIKARTDDPIQVDENQIWWKKILLW
jgi:cell division protein FtsB